MHTAFISYFEPYIFGQSVAIDQIMSGNFEWDFSHNRQADGVFVRKRPSAALNKEAEPLLFEQL